MKLKEVRKYLEFGNDTHANIYKYLATIPTWLLAETSISGNTVTMISMIFLILGGVSYYFGFFVLGFLGMFIYTILDYVDGSIARIRNKKSLRGYFLDGMAHQLVVPLITLPIGFLFYRTTGNIIYLYLGFSGAIFTLYCEITRYRRRICILEKTEQKGKEVGVTAKTNILEKIVSFIFNFPVEFAIYLPLIAYIIGHAEYILWLYGIVMPVRWLVIFYKDSKFDESQMIKPKKKKIK